MTTLQRIFLCLFMVISPRLALADFNPTAYYIVDGEQFEATDAITDAEAPLEVTFRANPSDLPDGVSPSYEWRFKKDGEEQAFLVRYEEETTYTFAESGTFDIALYVTTDAANDPDLIATIRITISNSLLEMPNAFSPNGDGINDIYKAKENHKSIVEFHAYIFNRWGQKLYDWTDINGGWDGTYKGAQVADGVYFVLVKAKGADGIIYDIKRDVNIMRQYTEGIGNTTE